jgi:hypothetical protein
MPLIPKILDNNLNQLNTQFIVATNQLNLSIFTEIPIEIQQIASIALANLVKTQNQNRVAALLAATRFWGFNLS